MKLSRWLILMAAVLLVAKPAAASSITVLVGDKDGFGLGVTPGGVAPWLAPPTPLADDRSSGEKTATNGAQLTDLYSALYFYGQGSGCDTATDPGCTPNGDVGSVFFPFSGTLQSATITILMGDFECSEWGAITADINGVKIPFCFNDGFDQTAVRTFTLTQGMLDAANLAGMVVMDFDHRGAYGTLTTPAFGSFDYIAFDYFQLDAEVAPVPEPATFVLLGLGLAGLAARRRLRGRL